MHRIDPSLQKQGIESDEAPPPARLRKSKRVDNISAYLVQSGVSPEELLMPVHRTYSIHGDEDEASKEIKEILHRHIPNQ